MANYGHRAADSDGVCGYEGPETPLICDTGLEIENDITWGVIGENRKRRNQCTMKTSTKNIFSFDLRSKTGSGEHWRDHATLGDRGYVFYEESPHSCKSYLNIEPVQWQAFLLFIFHYITNLSVNCASSSGHCAAILLPILAQIHKIFGGQLLFSSSAESLVSTYYWHDIVQVEAGDSGQYRCRVDYEVSPTRNTRIELKLIGNS